jgi:hypothetical protein
MAHRQPDTSPNTPAPKVDVPTRLIELLEHDPGLALSVLAVLEEAELADGEFVRAQRARLSLARGDRGALIEHGASGAELTPQQAIDLLAEALSGAQLPEAAITNAATLLSPLSQRAKGQLIAAVRASQDRGASVGAYEVICKVGERIPQGEHQVLIDLGLEIITRVSAAAGEINQRKALTLRAIRAAVAIQPSATGRVLDDALKLGVVRSYDLVHDKTISTVAVMHPAAAKSIAARSESSADLEAATLFVEKFNDDSRRGEYLRAVCKRYGDDHEPTLKAAESIVASLNALVTLHEAAPSAPAASHDEALLRRWAKSHPSLSVQILKHADQIGAARAPHTEQFRQQRIESERTSIAKRFAKEVIVANKQIILLVGGSFTEGVVDAFNEFHPANPQWGEWILKERAQPLKHGEVDEAIGSPRCAGVVIILKPAGHMIVEQARDAAKRHKKPSISINNSSKTALRDGLRALLVAMARAADPRPQQKMG